MKTKISPAIVGLFVIGALVLGVVALLSFGGVNFFHKPQRFTVYFDESIHGLDLGSPVKLRGVRLGRVVDLNIRYLPESNRSVIAVTGEISRNMIADAGGELIDVSDSAQFEDLIDRGLRAQLGVTGLATGLLYVELDFFDPEKYPAPPPRKGLLSRHVVVPAVSSTISEALANFTEILTDLRKIDFAGISSEVQGLLSDVRGQLNNGDTGALVREWTKVAQSIDKIAGSPEMRETLANFNTASKQLNTVLAALEKHAGPSAENLEATLTEARAAMAGFSSTVATLQQFLNAQHGLGDDATRAFTRLSEAAASVSRLADYLERNPSALLTGRQRPQ